MPELTVEFEVPSDHPVFVDHFPGDPLVPGALLLHWMVSAFSAQTNEQVVAVPSMKFLVPVRPREHNLLQFHYRIDGEKVRVQCLMAESVVCKGSLQLRGNGA